MPDWANLGDSHEVSIAMNEERVVLASELCDATVHRTSDGAAAPGRPAEFPVHAAETLRETTNRTGRRIDPDGTHILETFDDFDDFGASRDLEHGLESGSHVEQRYSIHPHDPLSARHEARWRYEFRRGDWSVRIDSESVMTSDAESFHLASEVTALEGGTVVIDRRWEETIPRGLS